MTTEEFHGHLMAALHGPNASEIVARVVELTASVEAAGRSTIPDLSMCLAVAVLADAEVDRVKANGDPVALLNAIRIRTAARSLLRDAARHEYKELREAGRRFPYSIAQLFEDR